MLLMIDNYDSFTYNLVRQGMSRDMADMLMGDIRNAIAEFEQLEYPTTSRIKYENKEHQKGKVFTH